MEKKKMAKLPSAFDPEDYDDMDSFDPIPIDTYVLAVIDSEMKDNSAGTGSYLNLKIAVQEGDFEGRIIWELLNLDNPSEVAVDIANKKLATLCRAVGVETFDDTDELHDIPFISKVGIKPGDAQYGPKNIIKSYSPIDEEEEEEEEKPIKKSKKSSAKKSNAKKKSGKKRPWQKEE